MQLTEEHINRRIDYLIKEATAKDPIRDQSVTYALRVITNFFSIGEDAKSDKLRERCPFRSEKAHALRRSLERQYGEKEAKQKWGKLVINEHAYPLKDMWEWILGKGDDLTIQNITTQLKKWPTVVVTRCEDSKLRKRKGLKPMERYEGITVLKLVQETGEWKKYKIDN